MNLEWWVVPVELHVDATYYVQHPTLKSVHLRKKPISNTLFSLKDSVSTSTKSSRFQNKWFELLLWETCLERSIGSYVKIGYLHHFIFMCSIIICFRKAPDCDKSSLGRNTPAWEVKPPLLLNFQYVCCKYIIKDKGDPQLFSNL